jgi:TRAP-type C4-dicarboxylate transport system substrate-binding protein
MALTRRKIIRAWIAAAAVSLPSLARAQTFNARQYHSQPEDSHLHIYLTKIWDAVRQQTGGRLAVTVHARNNAVAAGDPELLTQLQAGELEFFTLNGNILSHAHPAADCGVRR